MVIAGGGVAALEAMLALHSQVGDRVEVTLVATDTEFAYRPLSPGQPFGLTEVERYSVAQLAAEHGAGFLCDTVGSVDPQGHVVSTYDAGDLEYDSLIVALGATRHDVFPDALTFIDQRNVPSYSKLLDRLRAGEVRSIGFLVPSGVVWPFPLYELALMTAEFASHHGLDVKLTIVTPGNGPLALFGREAEVAMSTMLAERGIRLHPGNTPEVLGPGRAYLEPDGEVLAADALVALPRLSGPTLAGLPHDRDGFIPVDEHGRVQGANGVYAAGDCTAYPFKQGGLAAQQADAVAASIAEALGAIPRAQPFKPVLRGILLTGEGRSFLRGEGVADPAASIASHPLWWPPTKIAGRYLAPALGALDHERQLEAAPAEGRVPVEVEFAGPYEPPEFADLPERGPMGSS